MSVVIRQAQASDASELTALAMRSKAYWPYDADFIRDCRDELTVTRERAGSGLIFVAEAGGQIAGFYGYGSGDPEMVALFVDPPWIGKGVGKKLWAHALEFARAKGWGSFDIMADPYAAEKFYLPMGCQKIGEIASTVRAGRMLPLLRYELKGCPSAGSGR